MTNLRKGRVAGDVFKHIDNPIYVFASARMANPDEEAEKTFPVGTPGVFTPDSGSAQGAFVPVLNAAIGTTNALLAEEVVLDADAETEQPVKVLIRGPATVDWNQMPTADYAGTNFTASTLKTRLAAMTPPVHLIYEPPEQETMPIPSDAE